MSREPPKIEENIEAVGCGVAGWAEYSEPPAPKPDHVSIFIDFPSADGTIYRTLFPFRSKEDAEDIIRALRECINDIYGPSN